MVDREYRTWHYGNYVEATGRIKVEIALKKAKGSPSLGLLS